MMSWEVDGNGLYYGAKKRYSLDRWEIKACKEWIKYFAKPTVLINENISSYDFKHIVENTYKKLRFYAYISNGAFITAMGELGYNVKPIDIGSINTHFNIGFRNLLDLNLKSDIREFIRSKV